MAERRPSSTTDLIENLSGDLTAVSLWQRPSATLLIWLLGSTVIVTTLSLWYEPWRAGSLTQLTTVPRFASEIAVAVLGLTALAWAVVQTAVPGALRGWQAVCIMLLAWAPWLTLLYLGLTEPALAPSMAGKREDCYLEVMLESVPPLLLGLFLLRRLYAVRGFRTGALLGLAAGMLPALLMQLSCMYLVDHAWTHHVAPVLVPCAIGAIAGGFLLRR